MSHSARILIFTGDGKGKTSAALGLMLRATGHGLKSLMLQFIKASQSTGEISAYRKLPGVEIIQTGCGFVPERTSPAFVEHQRAARDGLMLAAKELAARQYDVVVLDEICTAITKGLLEEDAVLEVACKASVDSCLVLTGRKATPKLVSLADTVTEMHCIKHGLAVGRSAQKGVEY